MEKTLGYIFGSLQVSEAAIGGLIKDMKKQRKINGILLSMIMVGGVYTVALVDRHYSNKEKIEKLEKRIEGIEKEMKGE